jgi:hypothetical protein
MILFIGQKILIRDVFKMSKIIKKLDSGKILVEYYDYNNKLKYKIITENDIIDENEYIKIKNRNNKINKVLKNIQN